MTSHSLKWTLVASGIAAVGLAFLAGRALASGIPATLTYSGFLEDSTGVAVDGSRNIAVELWSAETNGEKRCERVSNPPTTVTKGRFSVPLPAACRKAVEDYPDLWVDVVVGGSSLGRTRLGAVPYAVEADRARVAMNAEGALDTRLDALEAAPAPASRASVRDVSAFSTGSQTFTKIPYLTEIFDERSEWETTTPDTFTAAQAGHFLVCASLLVPSGSPNFELDVFRNGSRERGLANSSREVAAGCTTLRLAVGDAIDVRVWMLAPGASVTGSSWWHWLTITRIP